MLLNIRPRVVEEDFPEVAEAYDRGRAEERARVVAWFKKAATDDPDGRGLSGALANTIERGEHVPKGDKG